MSSVGAGITPISGNGLTAVYKVELRLPLWGYVVAGLIVVLAVYAASKKEGLQGRTPAVWADTSGARYYTQRGTGSGDYSVGGSDKFLSSRFQGPDPAVYTAASQRMLAEGVSEGGSDDTAAEGFRQGRPERMSERSLEGIARGVL